MGNARLGQGLGRYEGTNRGQERPRQRDDAGHRLTGAEGIRGAHIWGRFLPADGAARAGPAVGVRQARSGNSQEASVAAGKRGEEGIWTLDSPTGARTLASVPPTVMGRREMQSYDGWKVHPSCGGSVDSGGPSWKRSACGTGYNRLGVAPGTRTHLGTGALACRLQGQGRDSGPMVAAS